MTTKTTKTTSRAEMRVLSVRQPFASLIASGAKTVELRKRSTPYRGPVLILAAARPWPGESIGEDCPRGVSLCVVDLVDCRPAKPSDAAEAGVTPPAGWFAWELRNPRPVRNVRIRGALGLNVAKPELLELVGL